MANKRKPKLGSGKRFASLSKKVGKRLAAWIGRKKYGAKKMSKMAGAHRGKHIAKRK